MWGRGRGTSEQYSSATQYRTVQCNRHSPWSNMPAHGGTHQGRTVWVHQGRTVRVHQGRMCAYTWGVLCGFARGALCGYTRGGPRQDACSGAHSPTCRRPHVQPVQTVQYCTVEAHTCNPLLICTFSSRPTHPLVEAHLLGPRVAGDTEDVFSGHELQEEDPERVHVRLGRARASHEVLCARQD